MSSEAANAAALAAVQVQLNKLAVDSKNFWLIWAGALVLSMQLGFMCLEVGTVRMKNTKNILVKNIMDMCIVAIFYWGFGYAFAYGQSQLQDNKRNAGFIGDTLYFYSANPTTLQLNFGGWAHMFFNFAFAAAAASIVSGALAERCTMLAYFMYSAFLSGFVYPVVSHWVWSTPGWLCAWHEFKGVSDLYLEVGAIDFAGSGVVHLCGGTAAAFGAWWLGARKGRFDEAGNALPMPNQSAPMQVMGTMLLWIGWYGFNAGSTFTFGFSGLSDVAGRVAICTTLSAGAGGITSMLIAYFKKGEYDLCAINNGALGGLVGITAGCATVAPWAAVVIGIISGFVYHFGSSLSLFLRIDDVVDAVAIHGWCGIWGCIAAGLFSRKEEMFQVYNSVQVGAFYGGEKILAVNVVLVCVTICWTGAWMFAFFGACHYAHILRVTDKEEEEAGLENSHHDSGDVELAASTNGSRL